MQIFIKPKIRFLPVFAAMSSLSLVMLTGCDLSKNYLKADRAANMEIQDFRDGLAPRMPESEVAGSSAMEDDIPSLQSYVAQPSESLKPMPLVSVSVNQTIPLRDVLYELAQEANYDIELDPRIKGSIIFSATERPFDLVVKRIADIAGLRYKFEDDILRVEVDTPYQETYKIDYLSYIRTNSGDISNNVAVVSGEGADTGSKFKASSESEADFWGELEINLEQMLGLTRRAASLMTDQDPELTAVARNPAPVAPVLAEGGEGTPQVQAQAPDAVLQVNALPNVGSSRNNRNRNRRGQGDDNDPNAIETSFSMNKQAGMVSIFGTERQHKQVQKYMKELKRSVTSQVLIEAKILEVGLTDEFAVGIDWNAFVGKNLSFGLDIVGNTLRPQLTPVTTPTADFFAAYTSEDLNVVADAISRFGTVRALASPRLTVLNNQSAVLNVADNRVYFEIDIDVTVDEGTTQTEIDSDIRNVPEGVLINVQPSIDLDNRTISMAIRPTVTRILEFIDDPAVAFVAQANNIQGVVSRVPVVNVQEMDSVVRMNSGQAVVMGGLMQDRTDSEQVGVPVLEEIPLLGGLFRSQNDKIEKTELVVLLKATIVDGSNIHDTDRDLYRTFSHDRRPLDL